jgi:hypothetical protein
MEAATFCWSAFVAEAKNGYWTKSTRQFLTQEEKEEQGKLNNMEDLAIANVIESISSDHQRAQAMNNRDANTLGTDLRNKTPRPIDRSKDKDDDVSALSNSTRKIVFSIITKVTNHQISIVHQVGYIIDIIVHQVLVL